MLDKRRLSLILYFHQMCVFAFLFTDSFAYLGVTCMHTNLEAAVFSLRLGRLYSKTPCEAQSIACHTGHPSLHLPPELEFRFGNNCRAILLCTYIPSVES